MGSGRWLALGVAIVVVIAGAFYLGIRTGRHRGSAPTVVPSASSGALASSGPGVTGAQTSVARASLTFTGRSIETDGGIHRVRSLHLTGPVTITIAGRSSADAGSTAGSVSVSGTDVTVTASSIDVDTMMLVRAGEVRLEPGIFPRNVSISGPTIVRGSQIAAQFGTSRSTPQRSFSFFATPTSPSSFPQSELRTTASFLRWIDAPAQISSRSAKRTWTSWAGDGRIHVGSRTFANDHGVLAAKTIDGVIDRGNGRVHVTATAVAQQVYLDGVPQFTTRATCDLIQMREETHAGRRIELTWAPRDIGDFDMVMTRIRPVGPAAGWLSFGLEPMPHSFGGESRPPRGGQTDGFQHGSAIRSVIPPGDADRRDVGVFVPATAAPGTYDASVRIEGNFAPVTVAFQVIVD